jgi:predicted FMN-binding regulatory protein PaiB
LYTPPAFREDDPDALRAMIREARLCHPITATTED